MQICRNINTWKCNCWAISLDKQGQCCDKVHLTLYTVLSTATLSKAMGLTRCARVCLCFCVCVFDRTTQVFSPRPPRYHQSLSSSFIKHRRCTWACVLHQYPPPYMSTYLFLLHFHSSALFPVGLSKRSSQEAKGDANLYIVEERADVVCTERNRQSYK